MTSKGYSPLGNPVKLITQSQIIKKLGEATRKQQRQTAPKVGLHSDFLTGARPVYCKPIKKVSNTTSLLTHRFATDQPTFPLSGFRHKQKSYPEPMLPLRQTVQSLTNRAKLASIRDSTNRKTMDTIGTDGYSTHLDLDKILDVVTSISDNLAQNYSIQNSEAVAIVLQALHKRVFQQSQLDHNHQSKANTDSYPKKPVVINTLVSQAVNDTISQELERVFEQTDRSLVNQKLIMLMTRNDLRKIFTQRMSQTFKMELKSAAQSGDIPRKIILVNRLREMGLQALQKRPDNRFSVEFRQVNKTPHRNSFQRYTQPLNTNVVLEESFKPAKSGQTAQNQTHIKQLAFPSKKTSLSIKDLQRSSRLHLPPERSQTQFNHVKEDLPYVAKASRHLSSMVDKSSTKTKADYLGKAKARVNTGLLEWKRTQSERLRFKSKHWKLRLGEGLIDVDAAFKIKAQLASIKFDKKRAIKLKKLGDSRLQTLDWHNSQQFRGKSNLRKKFGVSKQTISLLGRGFGSGDSWSLPQVKQQVISLLTDAEHSRHLIDFHSQFLRNEERLEWCQRECRSLRLPKASEVNTVEYPLDNIYDLAFRRQMEVEQPHIRPNHSNLLVDCYQQNELQGACLNSDNDLSLCADTLVPSNQLSQVKMDPLVQTQLHSKAHYSQEFVFVGDHSQSWTN